jgi:hypothetical protein
MQRGREQKWGCIRKELGVFDQGKECLLGSNKFEALLLCHFFQLA